MKDLTISNIERQNILNNRFAIEHIQKTLDIFLCKGKRLKDLKLQFAPVINVGSKTTQLGLFNFRSFLNIGMLLAESEKAKALRSAILDIVIATINEKTGGGTKYINRRDVNYIPAAITEENQEAQGS